LPRASRLLEHLEGDSPLSCAVCVIDHEIHEQPVAVLHEGMRAEVELRLLAEAFAEEFRLRVGRRLVGVVAALLPAEVDRGIRAPIARSRTSLPPLPLVACLSPIALLPAALGGFVLRTE